MISGVPDCVCRGSDGPHHKTFDSQRIYFMAMCKYKLTLTKKTIKLPCFMVEVKNERRGNT